MSKFKVGDRVRVISELWGHQLEIGALVEITEIKDDGYFAKDNCGECWWVCDDELLPLHPESKFTIGQTYKTAGGHTVTCVGLREDGGMYGVYKSGNDLAFSWDKDGNYMCDAEWNCAQYKINIGPVRETVTVEGSFHEVYGGCITYHNRMGDHKFTLTIEKLDGEFDWTTAKVTPCT